MNKYFFIFIYLFSFVLLFSEKQIFKKVQKHAIFKINYHVIRTMFAVLSDGGISIPPNKFSALTLAEAPKTTSEKLSFLDLAGYCDRFIPMFADSKPLQKNKCMMHNFLSGEKKLLKQQKFSKLSSLNDPNPYEIVVIKGCCLL